MDLGKYARSCEKETSDPTTGTITGTIPEWLKGSLIRNGPGLLEVGPDKYNHIFDGLALMHKFYISNGEVTYQNSFLKSDTYLTNMKAQRIVVSEFGTYGQPDPCKSLYQRFMSFFKPGNVTDNDLVNYTKYADQLYACTEANFIRKVDIQTLDTLNKVDISKYVAVNMATAHPHYDNDGTVYNIGSSFMKGYPTFNLLKFPAKNSDEEMFENASIVCSFPSKYRFYLNYHHSFGMTENYFIFVEQPFMFSLLTMVIKGITKKPALEGMCYYPDIKTFFHVIDRKTNKELPIKYTSQHFMTFHHINAYEENDHIIMDLCCYEDAEAVKSEFLVKNVKTAKIESLPRRYVLPLKLDTSKKINPEENLIKIQYSKAKAYQQLDGSIYCHHETLVPDEVQGTELPTVNYDLYNGKPYQYFYGVGKVSSVPELCQLKVDTKNKTFQTWHEANSSPSEAIFVQKPGSTVEDEGVVLFSVLYDNNSEKVSLVIMDSQTFKEIGRADFIAKSTVPADFHGMFIKS